MPNAPFDWSIVANAPLPVVAPKPIDLEVAEKETPTVRKKRLMAGLLQAIQEGNLPLAKAFAEGGADLHGTGKSNALRAAFSVGQASIALMLVDQGATLADAESSRGECLFSMAVRHDNPSLMDILAKGGWRFDDHHPIMARLMDSPILIRWWMDSGRAPGFDRTHMNREVKSELFNENFGSGDQWDYPDVSVRAAFWTKAAFSHRKTPTLMKDLRTYLLSFEPNLPQNAGYQTLLAKLVLPFIYKDQAEDFQDFLKAGFCPSVHGSHSLWGDTPALGWLAARSQAHKTLSLLLADPKTVSVMQDNLHQQGSRIVEPLPLNPEILTLLDKAGLPIFDVLFPLQGETLLHIVNRDLINPTFLSWANKHHPDWLWKTDAEQQTVFSRLGPPGKKWEAELSAARLRRTTPRASGKKEDVSVQRGVRRL
jgi:hypothetical protein